MPLMASAYSLRPATAEDESWLEALRRVVYRELIIRTFGAWDESRHARHCAECLACGPISVIEAAGQRAGMIQLLEKADAIEIGEIQLEPAVQRRGLGSQVLRDVLARAQREGRRVRLSVALRNDAAHRLYRRLGFHDVSRNDSHVQMECVPS